MTSDRDLARFGHTLRGSRSWAMARRFLGNESGQDIVEYALLGALIGISAILIWQQLVVTVGNVYTEAVVPGSGVQAVSACTPDPGGGGC